MKTVVAGSRNLTDKNLVFGCIEKSKVAITELVSGGAQGVDLLGEAYALEKDIQVIPFWADWRRHGKAAGPIRNKKMAEYAEAAIIIWDGKSAGARNMIENMRSIGKRYILWNHEGKRCQYSNGMMIIPK